MKSIAVRLVSLFAARSTARRDHLALQSRKLKQAFQSTHIDLLEERQMLSGTGLNGDKNYPLSLPGHAVASTSQLDATPSLKTTSGNVKTLQDLEPLARYAISASIGADQESYFASASLSSLQGVGGSARFLPSRAS